MNRLLAFAMASALTLGTTGCLHHNVRNDCGGCGDACASCETSCGGCEGSCEPASAGILSKAACKVRSHRASCQSCGSGIMGTVGGMVGVKCNRCGTSACGCNECGTCSTGSCGPGSCGPGGCGIGGCGGCGRLGCVAGPLGWQQGGLDYSSHLNPGLLGHNAAAQLNSRPFTPGPPSAQVAYPYYSVRGPRDFLLNNPPTIGR